MPPKPKLKLHGTRYLHLDTAVLKDKDLKRIRKVFPDLEILSIDAQNLLVTKYDLREFKELRKLELSLTPDDTYPGLLSEGDIPYQKNQLIPPNQIISDQDELSDEKP